MLTYPVSCTITFLTVIITFKDYYLSANDMSKNNIIIYITFFFLISLVYSENEPDLNNELEISVSFK